MFCDVFNQQQACGLLKDKRIWFVGSSNMRAIYKDVLWLTTHGSLASQMTFKVKNEPTYLKDKLLSNDTLHNGRNYQETREYKSKNIYLFFHFITRLYQDHFLNLIKSITPETAPDVIFLNSCLWDLSRWGPDGPKQFRENIMRTLKFLKSELPSKTRVIWKTSLPVSTSADGAIFVDEIKFIVPMLPWHILEANVYASTCADFFNYDTLDFHHFMRLQGHLRVKDGIHWDPIAIRYLTNAFLTHLCLSWGHKLPGNFIPNDRYLYLSTKKSVQENKIEERVNKKDGYFKKLFAKAKQTNDKKKDGPLAGIKNKILAISKNILKRKRKSKNKLKTVNSNVNLRNDSIASSSSNNINTNSYHFNQSNSRNNMNTNYYPFNQNNYAYNNDNYQYQSPLLRLENLYYGTNIHYSQYNYPNRRY